MANGKVYKIDFKLAADMTANYRTTMQHVERDFQNIERQFRTIEALRMSGSMVNPLSQKLGSLKNELKEIKNVNGPADFFQKIINELRTVLPDLREVKRLMTDISRIQQPTQRFGNDAERYVRQLREMEQRMRAIRQQAGPSSAGSGGGSGGGSSEGGSGSGVGGLLVAGGTAAMAGVAAVGAAGFFALKGANDYQKAMNQIQASTLASDKDMESLKQAAKGVYTSGLGEGWEEISQVLSKTRQVTGQVGKELENTTKNAIALQNTYENLDIESSLKAAQTATRNFKATSTQAYNLFAQGAAKGLDYSGELLDTSNEYSVYFKKLGFDMNQMFDVFAAGMENGAFNLDKVGDSVKEFGIRSKDGSKTSADAYKLLGLNAKKMTAEFAKGGPAAQKAWEQVGKALKDMKDPVKQNAAAVGLFGTQAEDMEIGVILALTNARKQFDMTKNTMEQVQKIKYNDIGTAFKMIGRQLNAALIIPLAEAMLPALSAFSNWFNDVTPKAKGFISTFGAGITKGAGDIAYLFQNGFDGEMQGVAFNIGKYFGLSDADSSQMVEGIKDMITAAMDEFSKLQTAVAPTINAIKGFLMPLATFGKSTFVTLGTAIMGAANIVKNYLAPTFTMVFGYITSTLLPLVITTFQGWLPKINNLISTLVPLFMAIYQRGIVPLIAAFQYAWPLISTIISNAVSVIGPIIGGVIDILSGLVTFLTGVFTGNWAQAWEGLKQIAIGIWDGITEAIVAAFNGVINVINVAIDKINGFKFDLPEWAGGGSFGGLGIEHIPTFADGGIATQPSIFGEAGPEMAIPLNNKQRSMDLLAKTNQMMGYEQSGSGDNLNLSFNITIQGDADKEVVQQAVQATQPAFKQQYQQMKRQNARVSLS